jgi:hypothetical protein
MGCIPTQITQTQQWTAFSKGLEWITFSRGIVDFLLQFKDF